jgi:UDP-N-acetylglucosamine 1-carboxyvinyltransferase
MNEMVIRSGQPLQGEISISGAKNSVLKLMAATVLAPGEYVVHNVPRIADVDWMSEVLVALGSSVEWGGPNTLVIHCAENVNPEAPYHLVEKMRASTLLLGALLARGGEARVAMPGGDDFGNRPIDMHLRSLEAMGASFELRHGTIIGTAKQLRGARIVLEYPSVGATENAMLAGVLAEGVTTIENAAREPEIADLAAFVNRMGANIVGAGSSTVTVSGVRSLQPVTHEVIPDRVEVATFLACLGAAGGEVLLRGARSDHLTRVISALTDTGMRISPDSGGLWALSSGRPKATSVATLPYPGLATDYLPMLIALLSVADGTSFATENLYQGRFRYLGELTRMGADITVEGHHLAIRGVPRLSGAPTRAFDIRAGAALVVAALGAEGESTIYDAHHIDRGYENLVGKLRGVGVDAVGR